jgi:hypothetical protein
VPGPVERADEPFPGVDPDALDGCPRHSDHRAVSARSPSPNRCAGRSEVSNLGRSYGVTTNQKAGTDLEQVRLVYTLTLAPR